ncbi:hypothetical protein [Microbacterium sp. NPDC089695]|uniref:hypothetical protein n=1 Tax=Microbacterium sp. NPDC089695 TaxID=3364198 RepID=UPI00382E2F2F
MTTLRMRRALALAGAAVALSVALTGCSALNSILAGGAGDADRDEETGQVTESANIDIFSLALGDCTVGSSTGLLEDIDVVPCSEPHDQEVFHEITMPDGDFSQDDVDAAALQCFEDAYTSFVGVAYADSILDASTITPTKDTWEQLDDRIVQCVIYDPEGQTTGSLAGSAR